MKKRLQRTRRILCLLCSALCVLTLCSATLAAAPDAAGQQADSAATVGAPESAVDVSAAVDYPPLPDGYMEYTFEDYSLVVQIPEDAIILTPQTPSSSDKWKQVGIDDPGAMLKNYSSVGMLAQIFTADAAQSVSIIPTQTDQTKSIFTFNDYTPEDLNAYFSQLAETDGDYVSITAQSVPHAQTTFFCLESVANPETSGKTFRDITYGTIINGYSFVFELYAEDGNVSEEQRTFLSNMVDSCRFSEVLERPASQFSTKQMISALLVVIALFALVVGFFVFSFVRKRQKKANTKNYADRLNTYHQTHKPGAGTTVEASALFVNMTEHSDEAIATFARYQAYIRNPIAWIYYLLISLGAVILSFYAGSELWITLLLIAVFGYAIYYTTTLSKKIRTKLTEIYRRVPTRKAIFTFYRDEFRISGLQASNLYPYFQITEVREYKNYLYLYFGSDTTYYVDKNNFSVGDAEKFKAFLYSKVGRKYKHYRKPKNTL